MRATDPAIPELPAAGVAFSEGFRARLEALARRARRERAQRAGSGAIGAESARPGFELVGHRELVAGDDPRAIDWAASARSEVAQVRLTRAAADLRWLVVVDASASMGLGERGAGKLARAAEIALGWVRLGLDAGARVALATTAGNVLAVARPADLARALARAASWRAEGARGLAAFAPRGAAARCDRLVVIGDLFDLAPSALALWRRPGRALALAQVLAPDEVHPLAGARAGSSLDWVDPESGARQLATVEEGLAERYAERLEAWIEGWRRAARRQRAEFASGSTAAPFEAWFRREGAAAGRGKERR